MAQTEFNKMVTRKVEIERLEKRSHNARVYFMTAFFTMQFFVGYHAIFNVPWLGWDLVEPLTYSVSQGSMLAGLFLTLRNRGWSTEFGEFYDYRCKVKQRRWLDKYDFDLKRYVFLL